MAHAGVSHLAAAGSTTSRRVQSLAVRDERLSARYAVWYPNRRQDHAKTAANDLAFVNRGAADLALCSLGTPLPRQLSRTSLPSVFTCPIAIGRTPVALAALQVLASMRSLRSGD